VKSFDLLERHDQATRELDSKCGGTEDSDVPVCGFVHDVTRVSRPRLRVPQLDGWSLTIDAYSHSDRCHNVYR